MNNKGKKKAPLIMGRNADPHFSGQRDVDVAFIRTVGVSVDVDELQLGLIPDVFQDNKIMKASTDSADRNVDKFI